MSSSFFDVQKEKKTAIVWLNRPATGNLMTLDFWFGLKPLMQELADDPSVFNILFAGKGSDFSLGLDIISLITELTRREIYPAESAEQRHEILKIIRKMQEGIHSLQLSAKPVVAAIQGNCIGGALDLISACDLRFCSKNAIFSLREARVAIVADMGSLQRLPYIIGEGRTRHWALRAQDIDAQEALAYGLVEQILPEASLIEETLKICHEMARVNPLVSTGVKEILNKRILSEIQQGLDEVAIWNAAFLENETFKRLAAMLKRKNQK